MKAENVRIILVNSFIVVANNAYDYFCTNSLKNTPLTCMYCLPCLQMHSDQLPFKCDHCQRLFQQKRHRDRHARLHASQRKLKCTQCDATFNK